jgi:hypothetical protein
MDDNKQTTITWDQIRGPLAHVLPAILGFAVGKGWLTTADVGPVTDIIMTAGVLAFGFYGWWVNRPTAIVKSAASLDNTTVVTTPDLAIATPDKKNVVANTAPAEVIQATVDATKTGG